MRSGLQVCVCVSLCACVSYFCNVLSRLLHCNCLCCCWRCRSYRNLPPDFWAWCLAECYGIHRASTFFWHPPRFACAPFLWMNLKSPMCLCVCVCVTLQRMPAHKHTHRRIYTRVEARDPATMCGFFHEWNFRIRCTFLSAVSSNVCFMNDYQQVAEATAAKIQTASINGLYRRKVKWMNDTYLSSRERESGWEGDLKRRRAG